MMRVNPIHCSTTSRKAFLKAWLSHEAEDFASIAPAGISPIRQKNLRKVLHPTKPTDPSVYWTSQSTLLPTSFLWRPADVYFERPTPRHLLLWSSTARKRRPPLIISPMPKSSSSMTVAPGGVLIVGSAGSSFVYKVRPGSSTAEKFIDASAEGPGTFFFGMLADASTNTLWTCQLTPVPDTTPVRRHTAHEASISPPARRRSVGICPVTTTPTTTLRSAPTKPSTSPTPPTAKSRGCPLVPPPPNSTSSIATLMGIDGITFLEWHALRQQRVLQQTLPHPSRCRRQGRAA